MNKYELVAKIAKYTSVVATVYCLGRFGFNVYFDNSNKNKAL